MSNTPRHIAIIMDGNGRWAQAQGKNRTVGHEKGAEVVRTLTQWCSHHHEIERLTLYAFSTENWKRPRLEVEFLMKLLERYLKKEREEYLRNNVRFEPIGDLSIFSVSLQKVISELVDATRHCDGLVQSLALNYGGRDELIRACAHLEHLTEAHLSAALDCPMDVDILIRTGGDRRLSNFLLWQVAYAELFFVDTLWPDFTPEHLGAILDDFGSIERRFGGLSS